MSSLWKLVVEDDKPAQQGDGLVRLLSESLAREAGLIRLELDKCAGRERRPTRGPLALAHAARRSRVCHGRHRFESANDMLYHEPIPPVHELRLPAGVSLLELRPFLPPGPEDVTHLSIAMKEHKGGGNCVVM